MSEKLTDAQRGILAMLAAVARRQIPDGGRTETSDGDDLDWTVAFDQPRARASTRTSSEWPWALKVHSQTAQALEALGFLGSTIEPNRAMGADTYYWITDRGREALLDGGVS